MLAGSDEADCRADQDWADRGEASGRAEACERAEACGGSEVCGRVESDEASCRVNEDWPSLDGLPGRAGELSVQIRAMANNIFFMVATILSRDL